MFNKYLILSILVIGTVSNSFTRNIDTSYYSDSNVLVQDNNYSKSHKMRESITQNLKKLDNNWNQKAEKLKTESENLKQDIQTRSKSAKKNLTNLNKELREKSHNTFEQLKSKSVDWTDNAKETTTQKISNMRKQSYIKHLQNIVKNILAIKSRQNNDTNLSTLANLNKQWDNVISRAVTKNIVNKEEIKIIWTNIYTVNKKSLDNKLRALCGGTKNKMYHQMSQINIFNLNKANKFIDKVESQYKQKY